ncbi:putative glycosyl hydrolases family 32 protein [Nocardioidaceae bacterium Broad-1]|nr:putative glycosyl hydrolases family 32 protein [Nocardioidaceae bacterium Broad-1]
MGEKATVHFRPEGAYVGDVIPFAHEGVVWLYYLLDGRDPAVDDEGLRSTGMPWAAVTTTDFVHFEDRGVVLPSGGADAEDFDCYTGIVVTDDDGTLHLFYTGHNPRVRSADGDLQIVCHATSDGDPARWTRHPEWSFGALPGHLPEDWRDPFVHRPDPDGPWQMLLAARRDSGPDRRRGVVATLTSDDLVTWSPDAPVWDPRRFIAQECPDVFRMGEHWYLVYSEFSDAFQTRYRIASSPEGPWLAPADDTVEGRAFYAAKTVEHDGRRYFIGWIASREHESDSGAWQWAGDMAALEAGQRPDGSLTLDLPHQTAALFPDAADVTGSLVPVDGADAAPGAGARTRHSTWLGPETPTRALISAELEIAPGTQACGLLLRAGEESGYEIRLEPQRGRMVFDRWPRTRTGGEQWQIQGDVPHAVELERFADLAPGRHTVRVLLDGSLCTVVLDGSVAMSARMYDHPTGRAGVFVTDGEITLERLEIRRPRPDAGMRTSP